MKTNASLCRIAAATLAPLFSAGALAGDQVLDEQVALPRDLTPAEAAYIKDNPIVVERGATDPPSGPIHCPGEYEPMDGILIAWEGYNSWKQILAQMGAQITTVGDADLYVMCDTAFEANSVENTLANLGADMSRVTTFVTPTDSIWMRDYGPRYIYEGDCRAVIDHTYNRPRPSDNLIPSFFSNVKDHAYYEIPLVHGGGNFHLDSAGQARTTRLINNENPGLTEQQIRDHWDDYQNVNTNFYNPLPSFIDSTQHIDMWMQITSDDSVIISDWPANPGSTQDQICDSTAADMAADGYTVTRIPAYSVNNTHYTYTNVVMCNDIVLVPVYSNGAVSPTNSDAIAIWESALPDKTIIPINCEAIVSAAGVMHCIVMHLPAHLGGENPTAYLKNLNGGETLEPGQNVEINWISDDDEAVVNVDILLSTNGGASFPTTIAAATADDGSHNWIVPDVLAPEARIRVVARDAGGRTGHDDSDASFLINGAPTPDLDGDGVVGAGDLAQLLGSWGPCPAGEICPADLDGDGTVGAGDLAALLGSWG